MDRMEYEEGKILVDDTWKKKQKKEEKMRLAMQGGYLDAESK